ncbi:MAG TPA: hypothetical protein VME40_10025 [Caulobacteraceae bacterium]|nr:hypothetical protein [Caulobacteraceae bacterium]
MRKILIGLSAITAAASLAASADAAINYNASKANTATVHCRVSHGHRTCTRGPTATHGAAAGKRRHKPTTTYDQQSGHTAGKRMH